MARIRLSLTLTLIAVLAVAGCTAPAASATLIPAATASAAPTASPAATAPAASGTSGASPTALSGRWSVIAENPRVLIATGEVAGSTVTIKGNRFEITVIPGRPPFDGGRIEFVGEYDLKCSSTSCLFAPSQNYDIRMEGGAYVLVNRSTAARYGPLGICGHPPIPGNGVITVESQTVVQGIQVPAVVRFTGGHSGGSSESACARYGFLVAWDLVGTRQP